jgi:hypothetical protein
LTTALGSGFRCISIGVPTITITYSAEETDETSVVAMNPLVVAAFKLESKSGSQNGATAEFTERTEDSEISNATTVCDFERNTESGSPTWPHPPTTTIFIKVVYSTMFGPLGNPKKSY